MCVVILGGVKDSKLREKLSEVETPTLREFTRFIDSHMHSRASSTGQVNATRQKQVGRSKPNASNGSSRNRPVTEKEKAR